MPTGAVMSAAVVAVTADSMANLRFTLVMSRTVAKCVAIRKSFLWASKPHRWEACSVQRGTVVMHAGNLAL